MPPRLHYTLFMLAALAAFVLVRHFVPKPRGLTAQPWRFRIGLALAAFVGGALGAKLPFVLAGLAGMLPPPPDGGGVLGISAWLRDGKTITTGLIGAYLAVELTKLALGIRVKTGDTFALPLAAALVVGRWGCFFNGCCYGTVTGLPWGVDFGDGVARHPTQAYESAFHLAMAAVLVALLRLNVLRTHHLQLYLIAYGVYRFATEFIRPEPEVLLGLTFYQWVSVVLIVGLSAQWLLERTPQHETASPLPGAGAAAVGPS